MPGIMVYGVVPGVTLTTSATVNTSTDHARVVGGLWLATSQARDVALQAAYVNGRGAGLNLITGISFRIQQWTTTASTGGTVVTAQPRDPGYQAATQNAQYAASGSSLTVGTGGPNLYVSFGSGATGPGNWIAPNPQSVVTLVANNTTRSIDLWSHCGTASIPFEFSLETIE